MPIEIVNCDQNTDSWYRARLGLPTASNFQCLIANSAEKKGRTTYLRKLATEIITGEPTEGFTNQALERGHAMEDEARNLYSFMRDVDPQRVGFIRNGAKGCSPDALIDSNGILEIKTQRGDLLIETLMKDEFPSEHKAQCQGALWVTERDWLDIIVYWPKMPPFVKRTTRDEQYIRQISDAVDAFNDELALLVERIRAYGRPREALNDQLRKSTLLAG